MRQYSILLPSMLTVLLGLSLGLAALLTTSLPGIASTAKAATYYFDSENGADSADGLSPETAWKTLFPLRAGNFEPGDTFLFKRGGLWRGGFDLISGTEEKPVLYSSYGEGQKPRFYGSIPLSDPGDWRDEGNGLWSARPVSEVGRAARDVGNIILNGEKSAWKRWTKADLQNQDDFWYDIKGDLRLWYRSDKNPGELYDSIEAADHWYIISHSDSNYATVDGLDLRYGGSHGFGGGCVTHLTVRNCDISWIGGCDQYRGGGNGRRVRFGNGIEFWGEAHDCLIENNRIWEIYDAALTNQGSGTNVEENITYRNNEIWNSEYSFEFWNRPESSKTENILFEGNTCRDAGYGWGHCQRPDPNGRHLMFYQNSSQTKNFVIRNNIFHRAIDSLLRLDKCNNPTWPSNFTLEGNTFEAPDGEPFFLFEGKKYFANDLEQFKEKTGLIK